MNTSPQLKDTRGGALRAGCRNEGDGGDGEL